MLFPEGINLILSKLFAVRHSLSIIDNLINLGAYRFGAMTHLWPSALKKVNVGGVETKILIIKPIPRTLSLGKRDKPQIKAKMIGFYSAIDQIMGTT